MFQQFVYIIVFSFVFTSQIFSQPSMARFRKLTVNEGLTHNSILYLFQDKHGYIWIGTDDGLNVYDGYKIQKYYSNQHDSTSLAGNVIRCIYQDKDNHIWIGTNDGLSKYQSETNNFKNYYYPKISGNSDPEPYVWSIYQDKKGTIWLGTMFELDTFDRKKEKLVKVSKLGNEDITGNIYYISGIKNKLLISTDACLYVWNKDTQKIKVLPTKNGYSIASGYRTFLHNSGDTAMYISSSVGILYYKPETDSIYRIQHLKSDGSLRFASMANFATVIDKENNFWIGGKTGLSKWNKITDKSNLYKNDPFYRYSLSDNMVYSILNDRSGLIWIGTTNGLSYYDKNYNVFRHYSVSRNQKIQNDFENKMQELSKNNKIALKNPAAIFSAPTSLHSNEVNTFFVDDSSNIWIGTLKAGISMYDSKKNKYQVFRLKDTTAKNQLSNSEIRSIYKDSKGNIWIGTSWGINKYNPKTNDFNRYSLYPQSTVKVGLTDVIRISEDKFDNLWIASYKGLTKFNTISHQIKIYSADINSDKYVSSRMQDVCVDDKGFVWCASRGYGLAKFDPKTETVVQFKNDVNNKNSLCSDMVLCLFSDTPGELWIGTKTGGLNRLNTENNQFENFRETDGLASNFIMGIVGDDKNNLWITTNRGLTKFDRKTKACTRFDINDGLQDNTFNLNAIYRSQFGEIFVGGNKGYNSFFPDSVKPNLFPPSIVITGFTIHNQPVFSGPNSLIQKHISDVDSIELTYWDNIFAFEFSGLHFAQPFKNRFAYKLEGFDKVWVETDATKHFASYSNIPSGTYLFKVKAANNSGIWSLNDRQIFIRILPAFWQTWWFRILSFVLIFGSAYGFYAYRMYVINKQKAVIESKNDMLLQQKTQIEEQSQKLQEQQVELQLTNEKVTEAVQTIQKLSEFGQKVTATLDMDAINNLIFEYVCSLMPTDLFGIGIYKRYKINFKNLWITGTTHNDYSVSLRETNSLLVHAYNQQQEIIVTDFENQYKNTSVPTSSESLLGRFSSQIFIPLIIEKKTIGVLVVQTQKKFAYNNNDLANLRTLASYISIAFDNASVYEIIKTKNDQIAGSIRYAQTIQKAILPEKIICENFTNFILYLPRDVVSGDFYWHAHEVCENGENLHYVAAIDCTGHGVPGAFMSLISFSLLNEIVKEGHECNPSQILEKLNKGVQTGLRQEISDNHDGMDICLCVFKNYKQQNMSIDFASAKRPLFVYKKDENTIKRYDGSNKTIGGVWKKRRDSEFETTNIPLSDGDILYLTTDGYIDQNNPKRARFTTSNFIQLLNNIASLDMLSQKQELYNVLMKHMEDAEQRDDITVIGIKV